MSEQIPDKLLIHITHFFNPNFFLFKDFEQNNEKLFELENEISECAQEWRDGVHSVFRPNVGDIVAYYNIDWNKWIRVRVCFINDINVEIVKYNVWAIDHGRMIETTVMNLAYLPEYVQKTETENIFHGSCCGYLPDNLINVSRS